MCEIPMGTASSFIVYCSPYRKAQQFFKKIIMTSNLLIKIETLVNIYLFSLQILHCVFAQSIKGVCTQLWAQGWRILYTITFNVSSSYPARGFLFHFTDEEPESLPDQSV
jgi:hypothetical protein